MDINDELAARTIRQHLAVESSTAATQIEVAAVLGQLSDDLSNQLLNGPPLTDGRRRSLLNVQHAADTAIARHLATAEGLSNADLAQIAEETSLAFIDDVDDLTAGWAPNTLSATELLSVASGNAIQGTPVSTWWDDQTASVQKRYRRRVDIGVSLGQTNEQIVSAIRGTEANLFSDGIMRSTRAEVEGLVRTSALNIANQARLETYQKNSDIIKGVRHLSTLDGSTSDICIARSGLVYSLDPETGEFKGVGHSVPFGSGPPYHMRCRSTMVPITRSWAELSNAKDERTKAKFAGWTPADDTRASMNGQVPSKWTFDDLVAHEGGGFLSDVIGPGKAAIIQAGRATLRDLINQQGRVRTVRELANLNKTSRARQLVPITSPRPGPRSAPLVTTGEIDQLATRPAASEYSDAWKLKSGASGTRSGIKWEHAAADREAGRRIVEVDLDQLRSEHVFTALSQDILDSLRLGAPKTLGMIHADLTADGLLKITRGQHRTLYAADRGATKILISVPANGRVLEKLAQAKKVAKKLRNNARLPEHPTGRTDTIAFFHGQPIQNRGSNQSLNGKIGAKIKVGGKLNDSEKQWLALFNNQPTPGEIGHSFRGVFKGERSALAPDQAAQMAFERGFIAEPSIDKLYLQLMADANERRGLSIKAQALAVADELEEGDALDAAQALFSKRLTNPTSKAPGTLYVDSKTLDVGDILTADDEVFRVIERDRFGIVLEDGLKYKQVYLEEGQRIKAQAFMSQHLEPVGDDVLAQLAADTLGPELELELASLEDALADLANTRRQAGVALGPHLDDLEKRMSGQAKRLNKELRAIARP